MSSASITSSKREKETSELLQELDSVRTLNGSLATYLGHLKLFKKHLRDMDANCHMLSKVNHEWIETIQTIKKQSS